MYKSVFGISVQEMWIEQECTLSQLGTPKRYKVKKYNERVVI